MNNAALGIRGSGLRLSRAASHANSATLVAGPCLPANRVRPLLTHPSASGQARRRWSRSPLTSWPTVSAIPLVAVTDRGSEGEELVPVASRSGDAEDVTSSSQVRQSVASGGEFKIGLRGEAAGGHSTSEVVNLSQAVSFSRRHPSCWTSVAKTVGRLGDKHRQVLRLRDHVNDMSHTRLTARDDQYGAAKSSRVYCASDGSQHVQ